MLLYSRFIDLREKVKQYNELTDLIPICRRYFVIGAFDGALTILGVILGAMAVKSMTREVIIFASIGGGIALGISSAVGAYEAERVEKKIVALNLKRAMLKKDLKGIHAKAFMFAAVVSALVHGISPLIAAFIPIIPFFIINDMRTAMTLSIGITFAFLFSMGAYMGKLVKEKFVITGIRFVLAGILAAVIIYSLGFAG